jgi:signal recognition particle receptor subunit beta
MKGQPTGNYKIIFAGPVGAGKTTSIAALSDVPPVRTDESASDMTVQRKAGTTVAMDYGRLELPSGERIHLYGTPGQQRFDFMWDILTEGGIGLVLLIDNSRPDPFQDMRFFLNAFREFIDKTGVVVGVTRMDLKPSPTVNDYQLQIRENGSGGIPIFEVDARRRCDVSILTEALLYTIDPWITA